MSRAVRQNIQRAKRRSAAVRRRIRQDHSGRVRMSVNRSNTHFSVQLIDDAKGVTLAAASTMEKDFRKGNKGNVADAKRLGEVLAKRAQDKGISEVVFDRGPYKYTGRVAAFAEAARAGGMKF